jgi:hypothetical protein
MKFIIFLFFVFFSNHFFSQNSSGISSNILRLTDEQVKQMIKGTWINIRDTIYYGEYVMDGSKEIKTGYSRYSTFLDSANLEYGSILIVDVESQEKLNFNGLLTESTYNLNEVYQLSPPYSLIKYNQKITQNGSSIKSNFEKKENVYVSTYSDGINLKIDTMRNFIYSLNDHWAQFIFDIDTSLRLNSIVESKIYDFSDQNFEIIKTKLINKKNQIVNGIKHTYHTTETIDSLENKIITIIDENNAVVESKSESYSSRRENKQSAINFDIQEDLFLLNVIPIDYKYCQILQKQNPTNISKVVFEIRGNKNLFDINFNQRIFEENSKNYLELNYNSKSVSKATKKDIQEHLKETKEFPINDNLILKMAKEATKGAFSKKEKIDQLIKYVNNYISYSYDNYSSHYLTVYDIIKTKNGVCTDYAFLFAVLSKAIGVPCRIVGGYALDVENGCLGGHAWNEVIIDGKWYGVDPTWNMWLPAYSHFKENNKTSVENNLSKMLLKLKGITYDDGKVEKF